MTERDRLDLRGLLPPNVMSTEQQIERFSKFSLSQFLSCVVVFFFLFHFFYEGGLNQNSNFLRENTVKELFKFNFFCERKCCLNMV